MFKTQTSFDRRACFARLGMGAISLSGAPMVWSAPEINSQAELKARGLKDTGIQVTLPPLADNSNAIPLQFTLQAPADKKWLGFEIIAPENPNRVILNFKLGQPQARLSFSTRIRLATTQEVWVVARLNDGTTLGCATHTVVTATACFDET